MVEPKKYTKKTSKDPKKKNQKSILIFFSIKHSFKTIIRKMIVANILIFTIQKDILMIKIVKSFYKKLKKKGNLSYMIETKGSI